ncbi:DUF6174 domain-containing protein [Paenimyroides aestuarii]|uniref:DUF6174 domain-containing protein n=1 Tax=Paenimyroides aestuarii TaxID=2968490 RepID=A0ABY5NP05_9FLAO|nr:DUF6174 domain-containing protein [Paenimyroides aestuarii]UUV20286.1 DUF6174 domain-containing protein [Paenimyroides aestuarii]
MKKIYLLGLLIFISITMSCDNEEDYYIRFDESTFNEQRALWEHAKNQNYSFQYSYASSTGPIIADIIVENGIQINEEETPGSYTIDDIYKMIENDFIYAKTRDNRDLYGVSINVEYNKEFHYPEKINYSVSFKNENMAGGGGYNAEITNFTLN